MKLIVGLGNPGKEYSNTRHNVGFNFLDFYLKEKNYDVSWEKKFDGLIFQTTICGEKVFFVKPQTFMNLSGECVSKIMNYYHIDVEDLLVISDDMDLNVGNFKLKPYGSCGGHNGLRNIEDMIHTSNYKRLKIGISKNKSINSVDFVLGVFSREDKKILDDLFSHLVIVLDDYFKLSFSDLMCQYNKKNK